MFNYKGLVTLKRHQGDLSKDIDNTPCDTIHGVPTRQ